MTVGFSYTTSEKDKKFGDDQAAEDNYLVSVVFSVFDAHGNGSSSWRSTVHNVATRLPTSY